MKNHKYLLSIVSTLLHFIIIHPTVLLKNYSYIIISYNVYLT